MNSKTSTIRSRSPMVPDNKIVIRNGRLVVVAKDHGQTKKDKLAKAKFPIRTSNYDMKRVSRLIMPKYSFE